MAVFVCPNCSSSQDVADEYIGRKAKCAKCGERGEIREAVADRSIESSLVAAEADQPDKPVAVQKIPRTVSASHARIIIGLLAAVLLVQVIGVASKRTSASRWEYKIESPGDLEFAGAINDMGEKGWELVFARRATSEFRSGASYEMIFKRPKR